MVTGSSAFEPPPPIPKGPPACKILPRPLHRQAALVTADNASRCTAALSPSDLTVRACREGFKRGKSPLRNEVDSTEECIVGMEELMAEVKQLAEELQWGLGKLHKGLEELAEGNRQWKKLLEDPEGSSTK